MKQSGKKLFVCFMMIVALVVIGVTISDTIYSSALAKAGVQDTTVQTQVVAAEGESSEELVPPSQQQSNDLAEILTEIDKFLVPVILALLGFGSIYAIFLGVMLAKADGADAREQAKKRMRNFLIGIVAVILLMSLLKIVTTNIDPILTFLGYYGDTTNNV